MARSKVEVAEPTVNKMQMVDSALEACGMEAPPSQLGPWIKETYGVEIDRQMISSYASQIRKKKRGGESGALGLAGDIGVKDIDAVKRMIERLGASNLIHLIKVLSR